MRLPVVAKQTAALPEVEPVKVSPGFEKRLYLFNHLQGDIPGARAFKWNGLGGAAEWDQVGNNWIADSNGDVRWYRTSNRSTTPTAATAWAGPWASSRPATAS